MAKLYQTTDEYHIYKLQIHDHAHGYKKADLEQPKGLDHIDENKYKEIIEIINKDLYRFYDAEIHIYYNAVIYIAIQVLICMFCTYKYLVEEDNGNGYILLAVVILLSNIWLEDVCTVKLLHMKDQIIHRINRNIKKYSEKNGVQWKFEIVILDDTRQVYLKYYIYRQVYDPPDPLYGN